MSTGMRSRADLGVGRVYHRQILFPGARGSRPTRTPDALNARPTPSSLTTNSAAKANGGGKRQHP